MFIQTEATPNPATLKFIPGRTVLDTGTMEFANREAASRSPLAERLFDVPGVASVFYGYDFVTVTKTDGEWQHLKPAILGAIMEHYMSGAPLLADGAMGTLLQAYGLPVGTRADGWVEEHPATVAALHEGYVAEGSQLVLTNTLNAHEGNFSAERVAALNRAAVALARRSGVRWVAGSLGPGAGAAQAQALAEAGVDIFWIETQLSIPQALATVAACQQSGALPIVVTFSFHRPETLAGWIAQIRDHPRGPTLRHRLRALPPLERTGLWDAQFTAISNLEASLAADVVGVFLTDAPAMLERLRTAARAGDAEGVAAAAHAIKGAAGLFSQGESFERARHLEKTARTGDVSSIEAVCADLEAAVSRLTEELRGLIQGPRSA